MKSETLKKVVSEIEKKYLDFRKKEKVNFKILSIKRETC